MSQRILWQVNPGSGVPLYRQIVDQLKGALASGALGPGDRLPTHRDLSAELVVAPLTVKKAYDLLQAEGLIVSGRGRGTFVAQRGADVGGEARRALDERIASLVHQAILLGLEQRELVEAVRGAWRAARQEQTT